MESNIEKLTKATIKGIHNSINKSFQSLQVNVDLTHGLDSVGNCIESGVKSWSGAVGSS